MLAMLVMLMSAIMLLVRVRMMFMSMFIVVVRVRRALMDAELNSLDALSLLTLEVHMKIAECEFGELPLESRRFDAEIDQGADRHVAADARCTIEVKDFHEM